MPADGRPGGPIVTLDGPAGSGKSSTAREVARRLGFRHLDSGALYRALTLALQESGRPEEEWASLTAEELVGLHVEIHPTATGFGIMVGGREVDEELRTEQVTGRVSALARIPAVRAALLGLQREAGRLGPLVADGRDMGTVVFPDADVKVFLVADVHERARRRLRERRGREPSVHEVAEEAEVIAARDKADSERAVSPLRRPEDAIDLDTTRLDFADQVEAVVAAVRARVTPARNERAPDPG